MTTYDLGAPVKSVWSGAPTGGTVAVAIKRPDGTTFSAPAVQRDGGGAFVTYVPDMAGRWFLAWTSTSPTGAYTDIVDIWPADPRFLISVDDARAALGFATGNAPAAWLTDLRLYIAAATPVIEDIVGPIVPKTYTQTVRKGWNFAALYEYPVDSITSVTYADATVVPSSDYTFNADTGLVNFNYSTTGDAVISYTAGSVDIPPNVRLATRELVRHWFQQGQMTQNVGVQGDTAFTPGLGFAVPRRVMELCAPNGRPGGFA